jgi:hypothetical protein
MKRLTMLLCTLLLVGGLVVWASNTTHAAPGFSNASLSGTYVFHMSGNRGHSFVRFPVVTQGNPAMALVEFPLPVPFSAIGDMQADGAGHITVGNITIAAQDLAITPNPGGGPIPTFVVVDASCTSTFTGTYSVGSDGTGTITIIPSDPCPAFSGKPKDLTLKLVNKGAEGVFMENRAHGDGGFNTIGSGSLTRIDREGNRHFEGDR